MVAIPTPAELKAKFPAFAAVADLTVTMFIEEATRSIDESWLAGDQKNAIMYLACHLMFTNGVLNAGTPPGGGGAGAAIASESIGDASVSYVTGQLLKGGGSLDDDFRTTVWGRRYLKLLKLNQPGVEVV
jgi:hypothetical protein